MEGGPRRGGAHLGYGDRLRWSRGIVALPSDRSLPEDAQK